MEVKDSKLETRCLHSLAKVFPDLELTEPPIGRRSALLDEVVSFQVAFRATQGNKPIKFIRVRVESELAERSTVRLVGLSPSEMPNYSLHDDNVLRGKPGLFPDPLYPISETDGVAAVVGQWRSLWVSVDLRGRSSDEVAPGFHVVTVVFELENGERLAEEAMGLDVIGAKLPAQQLKHTEWFHTDCLANYYGDEVFSEGHWRRIEQFIKTAADHGINMLLTPIFTPPLDTKVGGERPTVQLIDVYVEGGGKYRFGFDRLTRWIELCERAGIRYFEFSHLFTQWGAAHAPKIVATNPDGTTTRIFGWETDAAGEEYAGFLGQFLPQLVQYLKDRGIAAERCYFHISDEPRIAHMDSYRKAKDLASRYLTGFMIIDALSNFEFYESGLVPHPVPSSNHIEPFLEANIPQLWTYYCCSQFKDVSNRFFDMPSARNRIIGMQLYKFQIDGFLHWGYNFWNSQFSIKPIDPFRVTDADFAFPSGDAFLVYPGEEGPIASIRMEVFYEALQDLRSLELLESLIGREKTMQLLEEGLEQKITFDRYPQDADWLLDRREKINEAIRAAKA
ncbi:MAG: hypothetical protein K0R75_354 [Paenibacillaceae bacterium]|jgi:hypothetical protein|nr:hypothetical protein [Paenibacillaceae bacterium]